MVNLSELRHAHEQEVAESLKIINIYVKWIKKTPNKVWSQQQADLFKSFYASVNQNWRNSKKSTHR